MEGLTGASQVASLPMFGGAAVFGDETLTFKLRSAYGKGIRPSRTPARQTGWAGYRAQLQARTLDPEEQSGVETGFDLIFGQRLSLQVTRFDQRATGLIQRVAVAQKMAATTPADPTHPAKHRMSYALQNVGQITNRGWEMEASSELGPLSLSGALSLVGSRVDRVAVGYTGELRPGDRMLEVPARTLALSAAWTGRSWYASLSAQRAADWINYDRLGLARELASGTDPEELVGLRLRDFWRQYEGITHVNATASRDLSGTLQVVVSGENLLDVQRGEPDDVTILPGRTLTFGVRAEF
jgi:iron complex outermembrane receptor protein